MYPVNPQKDLDKIQNWLRHLEIPVSKDSPDRISAFIETKDDIKFRLFFFIFNEDIVIESLAFKAVSGDPANQALFFQTLLAYNATVSPISFAIVGMKKDELGIILRASVPSNQLTLEELSNLLNSFRIAFTTHIPNLLSLGTELGLSFSGKQSLDLSNLVKAILNE